MLRAIVTRNPGEPRWVTRARYVGVVLAAITAGTTVWNFVGYPMMAAIGSALVAPLLAADARSAANTLEVKNALLTHIALQAKQDSLVRIELSNVVDRQELMIRLLRR